MTAAPSFKQKILDKEIRRADAMKIRYEDIHVEPGFNLRASLDLLEGNNKGYDFQAWLFLAIGRDRRIRVAAGEVSGRTPSSLGSRRLSTRPCAHNGSMLRSGPPT